ncbi:MAG: tryptophan synthase subunit alpha [Acidimicrobiales bacterium]
MIDPEAGSSDPAGGGGAGGALDGSSPPALTGRAGGALEGALRAARAAGRKLLVPYVTGGLGPDWLEVLAAVADAGADALEVGIPFSDPVMDGPVIQEASVRSLARGTTPGALLDALAGRELPVPVAVMTYYNLVFRAGLERFAGRMARAGLAAAILPDLPLEEAGEWRAAAAAAGIETVLLAAPTTPPERLDAICAAAAGFVYGVGTMGVTGERDELAGTALEVARRLKARTDLPVLIGVGVSDAAQARAICEVADGVVVGSALVRRLLGGAGPAGAAEFVAGLRAGLDG